MAKLTEAQRARMPRAAFAYIDSRGRRRLPIFDEAHVRSALSRFNQVQFETDAEREAARTKLLRAAKRFGVVPVGFIEAQLRRERTRGQAEAAARRAAELPTGTVTFLMSDLEGSTSLLAEMGEGYGPLMSDVRRLIRDLAQRGLLESTIVMITTEFGRTPFAQAASGTLNRGRDHHPEAFTNVLAGAGLKGGFAHGATDEVGYASVVDPVTTYDLHATVLHLLGLDHERLTFYHGGIRRRLTNVHGHVVRKLLS